ncbi:MAG TPA: thioredoxin domain-containing protein [Flavisolibacter sp.]|nr:thioredoxin domain-containing protein [Flavisolibacter sp.]
MRYNKETVPVIKPSDVVVGDASAPVNLTMFGDYESEACLKVNEVVKALLEKYGGQLNFVFRHFPMTRIHQRAHKAAEAAIGAAQEGKFWEMHQVLFENHRNLGVISLKSYAREVGVKDKKFLEHLINSDYGWYVQDDLKEGIKRGVIDIPAIFLNGARFEKEPSFKNLKSSIDELLHTKPVHSLAGRQKKRA